VGFIKCHNDGLSPYMYMECDILATSQTLFIILPPHQKKETEKTG
jgi:hypothetical protein